MDIAIYLEKFEEAIEKYALIAGLDKAVELAKKSGLTISSKGHIVSCTGNPMIVLLRLIRVFAEENNMAALSACSGLIEQMEKLSEEFRIAAESAKS